MSAAAGSNGAVPATILAESRALVAATNPPHIARQCTLPSVPRSHALTSTLSATMLGRAASCARSRKLPGICVVATAGVVGRMLEEQRKRRGRDADAPEAEKTH